MVQGLRIEFQSIPCEKEAPLHVNVKNEKESLFIVDKHLADHQALASLQTCH